IRQQLSTWRETWQLATARLPVPPDATSTQVRAVLDRIDTLFGLLREARDCTLRINAIGNDRDRFREAVAACVALVDPGQAGKPDEEAITLLHQRLVQAQRDAVRLDSLRSQQQKLIAETKDLAATIDKAKSYLASLCRDAGCTDHRQLPEIERRWQRYQELTRERGMLEEEIVADGGGQTLDEIIAEAEGEDADILAAWGAEFDGKLRELTTQRDEKLRLLSELESRQRAMDGNDLAADAAERATLIGSEVGRGVHRFLRVRLASALLRRRIEEHRRTSQSPILERANRYFTSLTCGAFTGLATDFDADEQILVGIRTGGDGVKVRVEEMSDGTRDQLYLALRLAYLDHELQGGGREPMPLILDDILMNFDDRRSGATLHLLSEMSAKTQVIYFTHHAHLLDLAREAVPAEILHLHSLG
ncbi:MAG: hypothetical protein OEV91_10050, partial [Desulfobulbaceae bacterium]|nr:hypothetical protein [Desulfobulbaceae bacterium]